MNYWNEFLTVALIHFLAVASPGPDFALVTRNSLVYSRKSGILAALGIALGIMVHLIYTIIGVAVLISKTPLLLTTIKYIGAGYLIYIGYQSLRDKRHAVKNLKHDTGGDLTTAQAIKSGFITNITNPNATLFFLTLFTTIINQDTPIFIKSLYGTEMVIMNFLWFSLIAVIFSHRIIKSRIAGIQFYVEKLMGVILILFALKIFLNL